MNVGDTVVCVDSLGCFPLMEGSQYIITRERYDGKIAVAHTVTGQETKYYNKDRFKLHTTNWQPFYASKLEPDTSYFFQDFQGNVFVDTPSRLTKPVVYVQRIPLPKPEKPNAKNAQFSDDGRYWTKGELVGHDADGYVCKHSTGATSKWRMFKL